MGKIFSKIFCCCNLCYKKPDISRYYVQFPHHTYKTDEYCDICGIALNSLSFSNTCDKCSVSDPKDEYMKFKKRLELLSGL